MEARPPLSNLPTGAFSPPRPTARATAWGTPVNQPTAVHSVESTLRVGSSGDHWTIGCEVEELRGHGENVWISSCPHRLPKSAHWLRRCVLPFRFARLLAATLCCRRAPRNGCAWCCCVNCVNVLFVSHAARFAHCTTPCRCPRRRPAAHASAHWAYNCCLWTTWPGRWRAGHSAQDGHCVASLVWCDWQHDNAALTAPCRADVPGVTTP